MSMNIKITAKRNITFKKKNGKRSGEVQTVEFNALQTPTDITRKIIASDNPAFEYLIWAIMCKQNEHAEKFEGWLKEMDTNGFRIHYEEI